MKRKILAILLAVFTATASRSLAAEMPSAVSVAREVDRHYNNIRSLRLDFTETYSGNGLNRSESGTLWLKKPGKMRWDYRSPRGKVFVSDGKTAWFYAPGDQQARMTSVKKLDDLRSPLSLMLGKTKLDKELGSLSLVKDEGLAGDRVLVGRPKGLEGRVDSVRLSITPSNAIDEIEILASDGSTTVFHLSSEQPGVAISDELFHFVPPPGVEVTSGDVEQ